MEPIDFTSGADPGVLLFLAICSLLFVTPFLFVVAADDDSEGGVKLVIAGAVIKIILIIVFIIATTSEPEIIKKSETQTEVVKKIVSVSSTEDVSGSGNMCHYVVATNEMYRYYYPTKDGGYKQGKVTAEGTIIRYTDETPQLIKVTKIEYKKRSWIGLFWKEEQTAKSHYEFLVPEGSVQNQFNFN
jgi:hypothetical protein